MRRPSGWPGSASLSEWPQILACMADSGPLLQRLDGQRRAQLRGRRAGALGHTQGTHPGAWGESPLLSGPLRPCPCPALSHRPSGSCSPTEVICHWDFSPSNSGPENKCCKRLRDLNTSLRVLIPTPSPVHSNSRRRHCLSLLKVSFLQQEGSKQQIRQNSLPLELCRCR